MSKALENTQPAHDESGADVSGHVEQIDDLCGQLQRACAVLADTASQTAPDSSTDDQANGFAHAQLTGTLAHELRSPLSSISTAAYVIKRKADAAELDISGPYKRIENSLRRCNDVITSLLDKSWSNQLQPLELPFDEWLSKLVRNFSSQADRSIDIQCDLTVGDGLVFFDPVRMESVFGNILSNARDALVGTEDAPPEVKISDPGIAVRSMKTARGIEVALSNNGPCIPDDKLESILQPWVTTKSFGTGLGLPLVKCVLEQHRGGLEIKNLVPQGVLFTAWISLDRQTDKSA